jgi:hypothetical protein
MLAPQRLTPEKMVEALTPPGGVPPGHRRNHAQAGSSKMVASATPPKPF